MAGTIGLGKISIGSHKIWMVIIHAVGNSSVLIKNDRKVVSSTCTKMQKYPNQTARKAKQVFFLTQSV